MNILIFGVSSDIGKSIFDYFANKDHIIHTVTRNNAINNSTLSINNIFDMGGFQMDYLEPLGGGISEKTELEISRGGRTFSISFNYNFGKMQEEKRRQRKGMKRGGDEGMMDMGY